MNAGRKYNKTTLPNGIKVITEYIPHTYSVSGGIWIKAGTRHELAHEEGIAHFIEHMLFKGTKRRDAFTLAREIDSLGGTVDAFTSKEYTCYYFRVLKKNLDSAIELLSDMLSNPALKKEDIEMEKDVIIQEIRSIEDDPEEFIYPLLYKYFFKEHPLSKPIVGTIETIKQINHKQILDFMKGHYICENMIIAFAGSIDHQECVEKVWKYFKQFHSGFYPNGMRKIKFKPVNTVIFRKPLEQVHICIGIRAFEYSHPLRYAIAMFSTLFGASNSARLFQEIREKKGWAYDVYSFVRSYTDEGLFGIYVATHKKHLRDVLLTIEEEIENAYLKGFGEKEIETAKENMISFFLMALENTDDSMVHIAKNEIYLNRIFTPEEIVNSIKALSVDEISKVAGKLSNQKDRTLVIMGDVEEKDVPDCYRPTLTILHPSLPNTI